MELSKEQLDELQKDIANAKTYEDLMGKDGAIKKLLKSSLEQMLTAEINEHLGYEKHSVSGINSGNSRNGTSTPSTTKSEKTGKW